VIDDAIAIVRHLVGTRRYERVVSSAANAAGDLGTQIFDVGTDVKNDTAEIKKFGGSDTC